MRHSPDKATRVVIVVGGSKGPSITLRWVSAVQPLSDRGLRGRPCGACGSGGGAGGAGCGALTPNASAPHCGGLVWFSVTAHIRVVCLLFNARL